MGAWVQLCPSCGYCAEEIAVFSEGLRNLLNSDDYKRQLADEAYPELARKFCCAGMLSEADGKNDEAGQFFLNAAWDCDDADSLELAKGLRSKVADLLLKALKSGSRWCEESGAEQLMIADCLRRAGRAGEAKELLPQVLQVATGSNLHKVVEFELKLLEAGDVNCHTVAEAIPDEPGALGS